MPRPSNFPMRLAGLTCGVMVALLIWPGTSWLVRSQMASVAPLPSWSAPWGALELSLQDNGLKDNPLATLAKDTAAQDLRRTAESNPNDYGVQYGAGVTLPAEVGYVDSKTKVARLRALTSQFPSRPGLYAGVLRFASQGQVLVHRDEVSWTAGWPPNPKQVQKPSDPQALDAYEQDARTGESLDPDNAYFPFMRSIGLFDAHRDAEAIAEIERASRMTTWNEYIADDVQGQLALFEQTFGKVGVLPRIAISAGILFPQYAELSASSRVAVAIAAHDEAAGNVEEGLEIREALRRCGALMRIQATSMIGALVGCKVEMTAMQRPGGAPVLRAPSNDDDGNRNRQQVLSNFVAFLGRTGHSDQAASWMAEARAAETVIQICHEGLDSMPFEQLGPLGFAWLGGILALTTAIWMLVLWAAASAIANHPRIRTREGLPGSVRFSAATGMLCGIAAFAIAVANDDVPTSCLIFALVLAGSLTVLYTPASKVRLLRQASVFGTALGAAGLFGSAPVCLVMNGAGSIATLVATQGTRVFDGNIQIDTVACLIILAVPLLPILLFGCLSLLWRTPLAVGLARGMQACAMPISCFILLGYFALIPYTLGIEARVEDGLQGALQHEGRFIAQQEGREWPGATGP